jgi:hypothetical protein
MSKSKKSVLLKHVSGWTIAYEHGSFPSCNYLVYKLNQASPMQNRLPHNVAYCGSLESALNALFKQLIIEHVSKNREYCASLQELRQAIEQARKDFEILLSPKKAIR